MADDILERDKVGLHVLADVLAEGIQKLVMDAYLNINPGHLKLKR